MTPSRAVKVSNLSNLKVYEEIHKEQIQEAFEDVTQIPNDIIIVSEENEEIQTSKYLLSLLSPTLCSLIKVECCIKQKILLPDCSAKSIKHLLLLVCTGVTYNDSFSSHDLKEIIELAKLLSIDIEANKIKLDQDCSDDEEKQLIPEKKEVKIENSFDNFEPNGTEIKSDSLNQEQKYSKSKRKSNAVLRVKEKLGQEKTNIVTSAWNKVRYTSKSDAFLRSLMLEHNLSQGEVKSFFGDGGSKFSRLKCLEGPCPAFDDILT